MKSFIYFEEMTIHKICKTFSKVTNSCPIGKSERNEEKSTMKKHWVTQTNFYRSSQAIPFLYADVHLDSYNLLKLDAGPRQRIDSVSGTFSGSRGGCTGEYDALGWRSQSYN